MAGWGAPGGGGWGQKALLSCAHHQTGQAGVGPTLWPSRSQEADKRTRFQTAESLPLPTSPRALWEGPQQPPGFLCIGPPLTTPVTLLPENSDCTELASGTGRAHSDRGKARPGSASASGLVAQAGSFRLPAGWPPGAGGAPLGSGSPVCLRRTGGLPGLPRPSHRAGAPGLWPPSR